MPPAPTVVPPRARSSAEEVEERIQRCMAIMAEGAWRPKRAEDLAIELGCSVDSMRKASAEAGRRLMFAASPEEVDANLVGRIDRLWELAEEGKSERGMKDAIELEAKIRGRLAPQKVAVTNTKGEDVPPPALREILDDPELRRAFIETGKLTGKSEA